jgi:hypothetical protein
MILAQVKPRRPAYLAPSVVLLVVGALGCRDEVRGGALHAERRLLQREVDGLREAVARLERGDPILPASAVVVTLAETVASEFLTAQLPFEADVEGFHVRLARAAASFRGSPAVELTGEISSRSHPDITGAVRARGALEAIRIDPETGTLRGRVVIDHIDLLEMAGLEAFLSGAAQDELARGIRKRLEGRIPEIEIPVRIAPLVELPAVSEGPVRIAAARMPLEVSVAGVLAGQGVLWVAVEVVPGPLTRPAEGAPVKRAHATALLVFLTTGACRRPDAATPDELRAAIAALQAERDDLRRRLGDAVAAEARLQGLPESPVRVGVPTALLRSLVERVAAGFVDSVSLELRNLRVRKSGTVKKVVTLGEYRLSVEIERVSGRLKAGRPEVGFGGNRVSLALPVLLASGSGDATIDFSWDGKSVSGAVCGDMEIRQKVSGRVRPDSYPVQASLELSAGANRILATPRFPVLKVKLRVEPSAQSWAALQKILDEKEGLCGFVLDKVDIAGVVEGLVAKGFDVRLPTEKIRPVEIPVGLAETLTVRGQPVTVAAKVGGLAITEHMLWLGAEVRLASSGQR